METGDTWSFTKDDAALQRLIGAATLLMVQGETDPGKALATAFDLLREADPLRALATPNQTPATVRLGKRTYTITRYGGKLSIDVSPSIGPNAAFGLPTS